jgi:hypothetical protein
VAKMIAVLEPAQSVSTLTQIELGLMPNLWATTGAVFKEFEFLPAVVEAKTRPSISFGCSPGMSLDIAMVASCSMSKIVAALTPNLLVPPPTMQARFVCAIENLLFPCFIDVANMSLGYYKCKTAAALFLSENRTLFMIAEKPSERKVFQV